MLTVLTQTINSPAHSKSQTLTRSSRINAIDIQRGVIMCLMAFAHCREYCGLDNKISHTNWDQSVGWHSDSLMDLLQRIFISSVVAGGFFMMMGVGVFFLFQTRIKEGWSAKNTRNYLIKRGFLLIIVQMTWLQLFEIVAEQKVYVYAGVLLTLGLCMMCLAVLLYSMHRLSQKFPKKKDFIEYAIPLSCALLLLFSNEAIVQYAVHHQLTDNLIMQFLYLGGHVNYQMDWDINFTPLPWMPAVLFGALIGKLLHQYKRDAFPLLLKIAFGLLVTWFILRSLYLSGLIFIGDFKLVNPQEQLSWVSYFTLTKYPPSLDYFLWAWGINLSCIYCWYRLEQLQSRFFNAFANIKILGQCALFFFILHWLVYLGLSQLQPYRFESGYAICTMWLLGMSILFMCCKNFRELKMRAPKDALIRMF